MADLTLSSGSVLAKVSLLGGTITELKFGGKDILFPQRMLETPKGLRKRGGIPLLFPNADKITEESPKFNLPPHGFARDLPWKVQAQTKGSVTLLLISNSETKTVYPFDFELQLEIKVQQNSLYYNLTVKNNSFDILPIAPGLHPYFFVPDYKKNSIITNISGFEAKTFLSDRTLLFRNPYIVEIEIPDQGRIAMKSSPQFKILAVWSEVERDFICFEPWVGPPNTILHPEERLNIPKGESLKLFLEINLF